MKEYDLIQEMEQKLQTGAETSLDASGFGMLDRKPANLPSANADAGETDQDGINTGIDGVKLRHVVPKNGEPYDKLILTVENLVKYAQAKTSVYGQWSYDTATGSIYCNGKPIRGDMDYRRAYSQLQDDITQDALLSKTYPEKDVMDLVMRLASLNSFDSHALRLREAKTWYDNHKGGLVTSHELEVGDINEHLLEYQFADDDEDDNKQFRFWVALVARHILDNEDGQYPIDFALPLVSVTGNGAKAQGVGKTWFINWLGFQDLAEIDDWSTESMRMLSHHMFLFDEEAKLFDGRKFDKAKASITRPYFEVRMSYARSSDQRKNRYTMIAANHTKFLNDPSGARRFPVIEIGDTTGRLFNKRTDLSQDLLKAVWGQAIEDFESGWLESVEEEYTKHLMDKGANRRELSEEDDAILLYTHFTDNPVVLEATSEQDLLEYMRSGVPNIDPDLMGVPYVTSTKAKSVISSYFEGSIKPGVVKTLFEDNPTHYLTAKPGTRNKRYSAIFAPKKSGQDIWVHPEAIRGRAESYKLSPKYHMSQYI